MATPGNILLKEGIPQLQDAFVVIVKTEWNPEIVDELEAGCQRIFGSNSVKTETVVVPGSFEIPFIIKAYYEQHVGRKPDAFVALGTVIRGDTPHFDYVCRAITDGVLQLNLLLPVPTIFGVVTVDNEQQARDRIGGQHGHKGEEAAITAIKMIAINHRA